MDEKVLGFEEKLQKLLEEAKAALVTLEEVTDKAAEAGDMAAEARYFHESVSPNVVGISPACCSCASVTPAHCIMLVMRSSISTTGDTKSACFSSLSCSAIIESHAPMLVARRETLRQWTFAYW